jgi:hypothetical protein
MASARGPSPAAAHHTFLPTAVVETFFPPFVVGHTTPKSDGAVYCNKHTNGKKKWVD